jgi:gamma-glutamylcyclotransferase (GGCT)/AIG2-like uncharacterized protein YtfP
LYHLTPENYPAITDGSRRVNGWCFTYEDIERAMPFLDHLEGVDSDPPDYKRVQTLAYPKSNDKGGDKPPPIPTWVYVYQDRVRCDAGESATLIEDGTWLPRDNENGCLERFEFDNKSLLVIKNQPLEDLDKSINKVREFIGKQHEVGVVVSESFGEVLKQYFLLHPNESDLCLSAIDAGTFVQCVYRGPYYGLSQAWSDFVTSLLSAEHDFEVVEGARCFQIFANYGENTLAADLRTDLFIRIK